MATAEALKGAGMDVCISKQHPLSPAPASNTQGSLKNDPKFKFKGASWESILKIISSQLKQAGIAPCCQEGGAGGTVLGK